jgi:phosphoglycerol transferase MdoB-like AlkP superfamily enzyme
MNFRAQQRHFISPIILCFLSLLLIFTLSRLSLAIWQHDRIESGSDWLHLLLGGMRIDISSLCYLLVLPALLHSMLSGEHLVGRIWAFVLRIWITLAFWLVVYLEVATPPFILEYDLRPNRLFVEYLIYPKEVFSMLWTGYKLELAIAVIVSIFTVRWSWRYSRYLVSNLRYPKWYWRPVIGLAIVLIGVMGARSTFEHRPLNPAMVAFSSDPLLNDLTLNSSYSVMFAIKQMSSEASAFKFYPKMDKKAIIADIKASMNVPAANFVSEQYPTLAFHPASYKGKPKNIVILLLESHGAQFVSKLGGRNLSPEMDHLIDESWALTNLYATGTRSVRGIEAVTAGFSPTPARAVVKLGKSQTNFFTIADLLKKRGYLTQFIYGGESHFDNMKRFFLGNGFTDIQDAPTFTNPKFVGSWGASDEDLYAKADTQFSKMHQAGKPFFSLVFSSSNHSPFEFPDNTITLVNTPKATRENAVKYADYALGKFFAKAKRSSYWNDTVFLVVADHDARTYGNQAIPLKHFHIPALILGGGVTAHLDNRLASQLDLPPTLLSLAGISAVHPMIGHDLTQEVAPQQQRILMQRDKNFAWMDAKHDVVIFQPEKKPLTYHYDAKADQLMAKDLPPSIVHQALANALWGSLAYQDNMYRAQNSYKPSDYPLQK